MSPQLVRWSFKGLHIPMIAIGTDLVCTNRQLELGLQTTKQSLASAYSYHKEELESLKYKNLLLKDFLYENKVELGIERVSDRLVLWTEDAMLSFAFFIRTPVAVQFRKELRTLIKSHRTVHTVLKAEHDQLKSDFEEFKSQVFKAMPYIDKSASLAGSALQAHAATKHLRLVNY